MIATWFRHNPEIIALHSGKHLKFSTSHRMVFSRTTVRMIYAFSSGFPAPVAIASHRTAANEMQLKYLHCIFVSWFVVQLFDVCVCVWLCGSGSEYAC